MSPLRAFRKRLPLPRGARGFTLTELLVVISIMMALAVAALPAIAAFRRGQRLDYAGKVVQSALADARRRAITLRARHVVVFYIDTTDSSEASMVRHAVRIYQEPTGIKPTTGASTGGSAGTGQGYFEGGYVGEPLFLPNNIRFLQTQMECKVQQGEPPVSSDLFRRRLRGERSDTISFRRDGTIEDRADASPNDPTSGINIYLADEGVYQVPESTRADVVIMETESSGTEIKKSGKFRRTMVDVNPLTGRALAKTFDIGAFAQMPGAGRTGVGN